MPLGSHVITLRVTNDAGLDDVDEVVAAVVDTTPPEISVEVHPRFLWPPNHRLVPITAQVHATDACGSPSVVLESIESSDPDDAPGSGHTAPDIRGAQNAGMKAARIGAVTLDIERAAEAVIKEGLLKLGLITDATGPEFRTWYTHGICHWIGMDVHDVGDYRRPLEAGMAFVIEPGLYVREEALAELPDTPENRARNRRVDIVILEASS